MPRDLILLAVGLFIWGFGESAFFAFQPLYLQQLGADPVQIGAILGAYGVAGGLAHIPAGYLADRIGRRPLLWIAWIQGLLATWIMALASELGVFVVGMVIYGMTMYVSAPLNSYVAAGRGSLSTSRALALTSASYSSGIILGPLVGGWIGQRFGYQPIFFFAASLFILSTILVLNLRPQPIAHHQQHTLSQGLFQNRRYLVFLAVSWLAVLAMYLPQPLTPNYLQNERGINLMQIGQAVSVSGLGIVVMSLTLGRMGSLWGFLVGQVFVAAFALLIWRGTSISWYLLAYFLLGGFRAARLMSVAYIRSLVQDAQLGLAYGAAETLSSIVLVIAPPLAGLLYQQTPQLVYPVALAILTMSLGASSFFFLKMG